MQLPSAVGIDPSLPQPFGQSAFANLGGGTAVVLPANLTNNASGAFLATGNSVNVISGIPVTVHFRLSWLTANTGGIKMQLIHPGIVASSGFFQAHFSAAGPTTYTEQLQTAGASPLLWTSTIMTYSGVGLVDFYLTFTPSATGIVDLSFAPNVNLEVITLLAGSYVEIQNKQKS